jgi:hypothetical protein
MGEILHVSIAPSGKAFSFTFPRKDLFALLFIFMSFMTSLEIGQFLIYKKIYIPKNLPIPLGDK